jgi:hypothetical protein
VRSGIRVREEEGRLTGEMKKEDTVVERRLRRNRMERSKEDMRVR